MTPRETTEGPTVHELKTWPEAFQDVWFGVKTYEVRRDDRGFGLGDELVLRKWVPELDADGAQVLGTDGELVGRYTGAEIRATVVHKLPGGSFGLPLEMCVLGINVTLRRDPAEEAVDAMLADLPEEPEAQP